MIDKGALEWFADEAEYVCGSGGTAVRMIHLSSLVYLPTLSRPHNKKKLRAKPLRTSKNSSAAGNFFHCRNEKTSFDSFPVFISVVIYNFFIRNKGRREKHV